jgi:hypothetical protein
MESATVKKESHQQPYRLGFSTLSKYMQGADDENASPGSSLEYSFCHLDGENTSLICRIYQPGPRKGAV